MEHQLSVERSNLLFNQRVLDMGMINKGNDSIETLVDKLQFNKIFRANSDELFERSNCTQILQDYLSSLKDSNQNIDNLIEQTPEMQEINFEARLSTFRQLQKSLTSCRLDLSECQIAWQSGRLYYLSKEGDGVIVTTAGKNSPIYTSPIQYHQDNDSIIAWPTEDCVIDYLEAVYGPTVAIKPTISRDYGHITKIEFHGDISLLPTQLPWLHKDVVVVENNHLYIDDLSQLLKIIIAEDEEEDDDDDMSEIRDIFDLDDDGEEEEEDDDEDDGDGEEDDDDEDEDDEEEIFNLDSIIAHDWLMEYPFDPFDSYLTFLRLVSIDSRVKRLSLCLYRIGDNPILYYLLRESVRRGIEVLVNVETDASDEAINSFWLRELRKIGVIIIDHGFGNHKVHAKLTSVVFADGTKLAQIGTGNYHWKTTTQYNDLSLFTAEPTTCDAIEAVFQLLRMEPIPKKSINGNLLVAGFNATDTLVEMIREQANLGSFGFIAIKANSFDGNTIIAEELERASQNDCHIELIIRGCCTWVPSRLNDNVRVKSVVWEQLEHARVYQFGRFEQCKIYLGSLDPIARKLDHRLEVMAKVVDRESSKKLQVYLDRYLNDSIGNVWYMTLNNSGNVEYQKVRN